MPQLWGGHNEGFIPSEASRDGVIGLKFLEKFNVLLDFPKNKVILFQQGHKPGFDLSKWTAIAFTGNLRTQLVVNGKSMIFLWDTGSIPSVMKATSAKDFSLVLCPSNTPCAKLPNCQRTITQQFTNSAGQALPESWFLVEDIPSYAPFDGLIGSNFYTHHQVYLGFGQHTIYVK